MASDDPRAAGDGPGPDLPAAKAALEAAVEAFRRAAARAVAAAADARALPMAVTEARHHATFALAAVGAAFKQALRAARPDDPSA